MQEISALFCELVMQNQCYPLSSCISTAQVNNTDNTEENLEIHNEFTFNEIV